MEEGNKDNKEFQEYEKKHISFLRENAAECCLFLKKDDSFPLSSPGKVLLIGSGARETVKGGTGSGNVESRFWTTCEKGLEESGFEIVSKDWLDNFPKFKKSKQESFINYIKEKAENVKISAAFFAFGFHQPEAEYDLPLNYEADLAIYILSRISGEGQDRQLIKGDIYLTDSEIRDILYLNEKYNKFLLVLNVAGVVDLSPVINVRNILLLSLLGVVTGNILADIIIGKANPSGKLATTWASVKDYKYIEEFGNIDNTRYLEGIYVGYRYFDSFNVNSFFNFGFGLSYTDFEIKKRKLSNSNDDIIIEAEVTNIGKYPGKEVVQAYVSPSQNNKDKPYQSLLY
jgi:beta-glucosidase